MSKASTAVSFFRKASYLLLLPVFLQSCANDVDKQIATTSEGLHDVVFHAGWDPETRTVLQEDLSVWWSPGDSISLFVGSGSNGGYKLTSTNNEPAAHTDFVGQISGSGDTYIAIYPYNETNRVDGNNVFFTIPTEQIAKEGTFADGALVSIAVSDNESLYFRNLCGGIQFSVANEGIKKIEITTTSTSNPLTGSMILLNSTDKIYGGNPVSNTLTVFAPNDAFEPGKFYYAVVAAGESNVNDVGTIQVRYYTIDSVATAHFPGRLFQRSVFMRLYEADKDLKFKKRYALLPCDFLPNEIDKTTITEAYFHVLDPTTTATVISAGNSEYEPIYFEMIGTVAHFYTTGPVYKSTEFQMSFEGWKALRSLNLSMFDVSESTDMASSFANCYSLQSLNLSSFNTSKVRSFGTMFYNCVNLKSLDVTNFDTSRADSMYGMFENCRSLKSLDVSVFNTSSVTNFNRMFANCSGLKQLDVSGFDTSGTTELTEVFAGCSRLESVNLSNFNTSKVRTTWGLFSDCWNIRAIDLSFLRDAPLEILSYMFSNCRSLVYVDLSDLDLSKVIGFDGLFEMCSSLKSVAFPTTPIANVRWMQYMFDACSSLEQVDLSSFDTSNHTELRQAFHYCTSLKSLDLSHFDTKKVTNMSFLFSGCSNLEHLDISSFDSSNLTEAYSILYNTHKLTYLDLGDFNLENVTIDDAAKWIGDRASSCHIRCTNETKAFLMTNASWLSQDKYIWYTDGSPLPDVQYEPEEGLYCSTNYSKDKTVRIIQLAEDGAGIDLVLMGDAYSDRLIASGKYDADMERAINAIFAVEPFKSFKRLFNIYIVYAVSENEIIGKSTALDCFNVSRPIGSASWAWESYYLCAAQNASPGECSPVIIMNSSISDGAASGFLESTSGDYMNDPNRDDYHGGFSEAVAYISGPDDDRFDYTVRHEFGHSFGFLMDEYSKHTGAITSWDIESWQCCFAYGMWKNVDLVSDSTVKWAKFINDPRYAGTGIGVYEGALYETGAWRSSPESIMNSTDSGFNAPSREAIYYIIHKLAYGKDWEYNYEDFVTYDLANIEADRARRSAPKDRIKQVPISFAREPIFRKSIVTGPDGKDRIKIEMN